MAYRVELPNERMSGIGAGFTISTNTSLLNPTIPLKIEVAPVKQVMLTEMPRDLPVSRLQTTTNVLIPCKTLTTQSTALPIPRSFGSGLPNKSILDLAMQSKNAQSSAMQLSTGTRVNQVPAQLSPPPTPNKVLYTDSPNQDYQTPITTAPKPTLNTGKKLLATAVSWMTTTKAPVATKIPAETKQIPYTVVQAAPPAVATIYGASYAPTNSSGDASSNGGGGGGGGGSNYSGMFDDAPTEEEEEEPVITKVQPPPPNRDWLKWLLLAVGTYGTYKVFKAK